MPYRVHTAGVKSTGKPVSPWYYSKRAAEKVAKSKSVKTGRGYVVVKAMTKVDHYGQLTQSFTPRKRRK
jgi:hypothetical protein